MNYKHLAATFLIFIGGWIWGTASTRYPVIGEKVAVKDKALFETIDSLIYSTDPTMTIKTKYRDRARNKNFEMLHISTRDLDESQLKTDNNEFWLSAYAIYPDDDVLGHYFFNSSHYKFLSYDYDDRLFKAKLGIKQQLGWNYMKLFLNGIGPLWYFKIVDGRIAEAYYTYDQLDEFTGVVYDLLNKRIVSEGFGESGY